MFFCFLRDQTGNQQWYAEGCDWWQWKWAQVLAAETASARETHQADPEKPVWRDNDLLTSRGKGCEEPCWVKKKTVSMLNWKQHI